MSRTKKKLDASTMRKYAKIAYTELQGRVIGKKNSVLDGILGRHINVELTINHELSQDTFAVECHLHLLSDRDLNSIQTSIRMKKQ